MLKLSLCMIARNEEAMLGDCLASVRGAVHEVIVVDTGSTDRTREIAREAGAQIFEFAWIDDFAAARNESLAHATGDWVLILDADERLAEGAGAAILHAIRDAVFDCGMLPMHQAARKDAPLSQVVSGTARLGEANYLPRLLRRNSGLAYQGRVHENVLDWLRRGGMRVAYVEAPIVHLGAVPEVRAQRDKSARNIALLEQLCAERPSEIAPYGYLAHELLQAGREADAKVVIERGWSLVTEEHRDQRVSILLLANARATALLPTSNGAAIVETADRAERFEGPHPDFDMMRGVGNELLALAAPAGSMRIEHFERAATSYRAALAKKNTRYMVTFVTGGTSWAGATRLGAVLLAQDRPAEAQVAFDAALQVQPDYREAQIGRLEALLDLGDPKALLVGIESLLDDRPDGWLLAAAAFEALGMLKDMEVFLARALERRKRGYLSPHRVERQAALTHALSAYRGAPAAGFGATGALGALLARAPLPRGSVPPFTVCPRRVKTLLANLIASGNGALIEGWLEPRAEAVLPGLAAAANVAAAELGLSLADDGEPTYAFCHAEDARGLDLLAAALAAHRTLKVVRGAAGVLADASQAADLRSRIKGLCGPERRAVILLGPGDVPMARLGEAFPGARWVLLCAREAPRTPNFPAPAGPTVLDLRSDDLSQRPHLALPKLWAFLGEAEPPACSSLDTEGRIRSVECGSNGTRANNDIRPVG